MDWLFYFSQQIRRMSSDLLKHSARSWFLQNTIYLSSEFWARQAQRKVSKLIFLYFSYWAWSTPWGHVLSLKSFCQNSALTWAIRYSVFQLVKFASSFKFVCRTIFSTFWHLVVKFGYNKWFWSNKKSSHQFL